MEEIKEFVLERLDMSQDMEDEDILAIIDEEICARAHRIPMTIQERRTLQKQVFYSLRRLDILQELIEDSTITEIMINGYNKIFYEQAGNMYLWEKEFQSAEKLEDIIQMIVSSNNRTVNESSPIVDTRLKDGSRINVVLSPVSIDGSCISIRKFPDNPITMETLLSNGTVGENIVAFLKKVVRSGYNIFISGGTSSGKTTFLNALSNYIPEEERIVTIEDSAELKIQNIPNLVRLETRNGNMGDGKEVTIRDLIRTALRMRPNRIIVGEIRGLEALDMLQAMNTGHDGSLSTGHSNSSADMLSRIETMVLMGMDLPLGAVRRQIASGIDILIHLGKLRDNTRKVLDIVEITGYEKEEISLNPLFRYQENNSWKQIGTLLHTDKLKAAGYEVTIDERL